MLSRRHPRGPLAYEGRQSETRSMFRMLAGHWRPVVAELRRKDAGLPDYDEPAQRKTLPSCWSPWLLIK